MCAQPSCCGCCDITKNYFLQPAFLRGEASRGCKGRTFLIKLFPTLRYKVGEKSSGSLENISNDDVVTFDTTKNCLSCLLVWVVCASTYPQTVFPGVATRLLNSWWRREHIRHMHFFQPKKKERNALMLQHRKLYQHRRCAHQQKLISKK